MLQQSLTFDAFQSSNYHPTTSPGFKPIDFLGCIFCKTIVLDKKQQRTPFASLLFDWQSLIVCKFFSFLKTIQKPHVQNMWFFPLQTSRNDIQTMHWNWCLPTEWKKTNIAPIHKKGDKQTLENYRPVSLLLICGKILEKLLFNETFNFSLKTNLFHQISPVLNQVILTKN